MVAATFSGLEMSAFAQLLFTCPVQPSEHPSPAAIRMAVHAQFRRFGGDLTACLAAVAQQAGDHPDCYAERMRWAIRSVDCAYARQPGGRAAVSRAA